MSNCSFHGFRSAPRVALREAGYVAANPVASGMALTHVEVLNSRFSGNEDSILLLGDDTAAPTVLRQSFLVEENTISGVGSDTNGYQFGVRITVGASGTVSSNIISDCLASGSVPALGLLIGSAAVLAFDTSSVGVRSLWTAQPVFIEGNTLTNNAGGVNLFAADGSRVTNNRIEGVGAATGVTNEGGICISGTNVIVVNSRA